MDIEVKKAIDGLGEAWEAFKQTHSQELAEIKKGSADYVTTDKLAKIDAAIDAHVEQKAALEARIAEIEKKGARPGTAADEKSEVELKGFNRVVLSVAAERGLLRPEALSAEDYDAYKSGFSGYLKSGGALSLERKDMSVYSDPEGGYLVPESMAGRIITRVFETSPIRQIANVITITGDSIGGLNDRDEAAAGWVSEAGTRSDTNTPQLGKWEIEVHEMYAQPRATQKVLDMAAVDVEAWLAGKVTDKFARTENAAYVAGDGVGKPRGFTTYTTAATADASRTWGTIEHLATGNSGAFASSAGGDVLFNVVGAMNPAYLPNARWVTRRTVVTAVRKLKGATTGDYLWQPGLAAGQPQQILGYPVVLAEDMPALGSNSLSMAFGDFNEAYQIVDGAGIRVLRDPFTAKPYVRFYTTKRTGGAVVNFDAIKFVYFG